MKVLIFLLLIFTTNTKASCIRETINQLKVTPRELVKVYNPFTAIKKDIDLKELHFEIEYITGGNLYSYTAEPKMNLALFYKGEKIGSPSVHSLPRKKAYIYFLGGIEDDMQGKGIGSLVYHTVSRILYKEEDIILRTDPEEISDDAVKLWNRLARDGLVRSSSRDNKSFKKSYLCENNNFKYLDKFINSNVSLSITPYKDPKDEKLYTFLKSNLGDNFMLSDKEYRNYRDMPLEELNKKIKYFSKKYKKNPDQFPWLDNLIQNLEMIKRFQR